MYMSKYCKVRYITPVAYHKLEYIYGFRLFSQTSTLGEGLRARAGLHKESGVRDLLRAKS